MKSKTKKELTIDNIEHDSSKRTFIGKSAAAVLGGLLGAKVIFAENFPSELEPVGLITETPINDVPGKSDKLSVLNNRPWNAETPAHLLDPAVTSTKSHFVRNNGIPPVKINVDTWTLSIDGESAAKKVTLSLHDLKSKFKHYSYHLTIECAGNGRAEFNPSARGNQWTLGAVGCAKWTGVRLKDVLNYAGVKSDAAYIGYYGTDTHLQDPSKVVISRGVPIKKAMEDESLIAWSMNGEDIPLMNGHPLRLVIGGWPASVSGKWLRKIRIRNKVHDGPKMGGQSYRMPKFPIEPGSKVRNEDMEIIESMPIKSIITYPKSGAIIGKSKSFHVRGHAWAGDLSVREVHVSVDFGVTWKKCELSIPVNRFAWQHWKTTVRFSKQGYYEIWARATDSEGKIQPMILAGWNPKGYLNNACHRIAVKQS